jgi:hypothetical protein
MRNVTLARVFIYKQKLDEVVRGFSPQTTQLATGRIDINRLIGQLEELRDEGKEYAFVTGFLATNRDDGTMHTHGSGKEKRVGINIKLSQDREQTLGEALPDKTEDQADYTVDNEGGVQAAPADDEVPF